MRTFRPRAAAFLVSLSAFCLVSTLAQAPQPSSPTGNQIALREQTPNGVPMLQERYPRYIIQREDVLLIQFPLTPELNQTVTVQPDGFITLQSAGSTHIQGMTVPQAIEAIKDAYKGILHEPIVNVDLQDFQKPFFSVTGQVGKPGQYELRSDLTVTEAIAVAGGLSPTSRQQAFLFHRANAQWYHVEKLNLKDIYNGKKANEDAILKPGDMIFVPENNITKFRKYVPYGVSAGSYFAENQNP
jgi:polysaccharide export outer membrane protein